MVISKIVATDHGDAKQPLKYLLIYAKLTSHATTYSKAELSRKGRHGNQRNVRRVSRKEGSGEATWGGRRGENAPESRKTGTWKSKLQVDDRRHEESSYLTLGGRMAGGVFVNTTEWEGDEAVNSWHIDARSVVLTVTLQLYTSRRPHERML